MKTNPNDPATGYIDQNYEATGLSKREMIAAMCMQGLLAKYGDSQMQASSESAVQAADALIAQLNREETSTTN